MGESLNSLIVLDHQILHVGDISRPNETETTTTNIEEIPSHSDNLDYLINVVYAPFIKKRVKVKNLLSYMPEFMKEIGPHIYNSTSAEMSTEIFFNHLKAVNDVGKYQAFKDALHSANYEVIVKVLEGEKIEDDSEHKELMQLFESTIMDSIDPSALAQRLLERDVIDPSEREYIENIQTQKGVADASFYLLDCVPRRKDGWFKIFLEVLDQLDHKDLVKLLDEKFYQQSGDCQPGELSLQVDTEMTNEITSDTTREMCNEIPQQMRSEMTVERTRDEATVGGGSGSDEMCSISIFMQQVLRSLTSLQEQVNRIETNLSNLHAKLDSLNKTNP